MLFKTVILVTMQIKVTAIYGCGECTAPPDWYTKGLPRPYRLYYVIEGVAHYSLGGEKTELLPGHFYLFPSSLPFTVEQDSKHRLNHLYYDFMMSPSVISATPLCCSTDEHTLLPAFLTLMRSSIKEYRYEGHAELFDTVISTLEAFLSLFLEIAKPKKEISADIIKALEYIESNYAEDIRVRDIADLLYLDEDYFIKKFKSTMGITPYAYIKNLRMAVTKELCKNGETLKSASATAGFKYPSSYCRAVAKRQEKK